ncbi:MAG: hypothetical protein CMK83_15440 [Pseudomonadales bacterium]|jgi:hypothetical protein|nr:hypothetical protein [Pseudomonadales bacterium]TNC90610.1 MAG: hypothetical protein CSH49_01915 [Alcanivorax sp.]HAU12127.1 hypothetical protein [Gammaproteobacteria bacterium]MBI25700.1 hypothetical protein [Pseudomonadales bacterium]HBO94875.1 hypothetical protein [Gammaproteobacteria bacterium]|tara:strand:- start:62332 stop:62733 length:402 start_codon:yes stop_codon:yes gene_type:complete
MIRFIVCHLHRSSARLRFLNFNDHLCGPAPLPKLVELIDEPPAAGAPSEHPSPALQQLKTHLQLAEPQLELIPGFRCWIEAPGEVIPVYMAAATDRDPFPPPAGSHWIELPESWMFTPLERELLREAYEFLLT